jgi:ubiquinone biosynthesis protein
LAGAIREELDFRVEARNIAAVAAASRRPVRVPSVHEELSGRCVLVMERLRGVPVRTAGPALAERGLDPHALAVGLLHALLHQIVTAGVFHADPHPGNVLLLEDGGLGLLDFGSVGRLDSLVRVALVEVLLAVERRDASLLRDSLLGLAQHPDDIDERCLTRELSRFVALHLSPGTPTSIATFIDLFGVVAGSGLTVPPEAAAAFRALATLDGTLTQLDPGFDLVTEARRFAGTQLTSSLPKAVRDDLSALLPTLSRLPRRVYRIAAVLEQGRLNMNIRLLADERDRRVITKLVHEALLAFVGAAVGLMGVLLLTAQGGPAVTETITLHQLLGYNLLLVGFLLVLRVLFVVFRPERTR